MEAPLNRPGSIGQQANAISLFLPSGPTSDPLRGHPRYQTEGVIGVGGTGFVVVAKDTSNSNQQVAVKVLPRSRVHDKYLQREIMNHSMLQHPHIVEFNEVFVTDQHICIVMEYATGGTLRHFINKRGALPEVTARWFFQQLVVTVDYCHRRGVVNRDMKLENVLLHWVQDLPLPLLKICDFGYSKSDYQSAPKTKVGTLAYMAPEVIANMEDMSYDGKLADVWSCGVMLYCMLYGRLPFLGRDEDISSTTGLKQVVLRITSLQYVVPPSPEVSEPCKDLLRLMLAPAEERITLSSIQQHPWYRNGLIPGADTMNDELLSEEQPTGTQAQIEAVFMSAAGMGPPPPRAPPVRPVEVSHRS